MDKDALQTMLSEMDAVEKYRVEKVLKEGPLETTEVVYQIGADGSEIGPFIRKLFRNPEQQGVYSRILEAQQNGLRDPRLPRVVEVGEGFAVTEMVRGKTLRECEPEIERSMFEDVCEAVRILHERFDPPIIHRDVKPDNVMVTQDGVVLIDFGSARTAHESDDPDTHPVATQAYAPPEQFGYAQTGVQSDVYALGMLLAFLETGRDPWPELKSAASEGAEALERLGVSHGAARVIKNACAFDPKMRYANVKELLEAYGRTPSALNPPDAASVYKAEIIPGGKEPSWDDAFLMQRPEKITFRWLVNVVVRFPEAGPKPLLIAKDAAIVATWLFFLVCSIGITVDPTREAALMPVWARILAYCGVVMSLFGAIGAAFFAFDPLRRFRVFRNVKRSRVVAAFLAVFVICMVILGATGHMG